MSVDEIVREFETGILSERASYLLGYLLGDGCLGWYRRDPVVKVTTSDEEMVTKLREILPFAVSRDSREGVRTSYNLVLYSKKLYTCLVRMGLGPQKSKVGCSLPRVSRERFYHMVRGLFDSDGGISVRKACQVFLLGHSSYMGELVGSLHGDGIQGSCFLVRGRKSLVSFRVSTASIIDFYKKLYSGATVFMERKRERFRIYFSGKSCKHQLIQIDGRWCYKEIIDGVVAKTRLERFGERPSLEEIESLGTGKLGLDQFLTVVSRIVGDLSAWPTKGILNWSLEDRFYLFGAVSGGGCLAVDKRGNWTFSIKCVDEDPIRWLSAKLRIPYRKQCGQGKGNNLFLLSTADRGIVGDLLRLGCRPQKRLYGTDLSRVLEDGKKPFLRGFYEMNSDLKFRGKVFLKAESSVMKTVCSWLGLVRSFGTEGLIRILLNDEERALLFESLYRGRDYVYKRKVEALS